MNQQAPDPIDTSKPAEPETEATTEKEPAQEPGEKLKSIGERLKERAGKFIREHFKGEHVDEEPTKFDAKQVTKTIGSNVIGAAASVGGIKSFADVPRWLLQKHYTKQEQARIKSALDVDTMPDVGFVRLKTDSGGIEEGWEIVEQVDEDNIKIRKGDRERVVGTLELDIPKVVSPLEKKKQKLEEAVKASKYLSEAKKAELLQKLHLTVEGYEDRLATLEQERNEKIAKLLDETIQTRVKGTTALKEALNTALIASGLVTLRGVGYGAVALYERYAKVQQERERGERTGGQFKEVVVNGFKETVEKLRFKKGETKVQRLMNFGQALGTVGRFAGFAGLATTEMTGEGGPSAAIEKALEVFEQKGVLGAVGENYGEQIERVKDMATLGLLTEEEPIESPPTAAPDTVPIVPEAPSTAPEPAPPAEPEPTSTAPEGSEENPIALEPLEIKAGENYPDEPEEPEETVAGEPHDEISQEALQTGTVHKGDSFTSISQRHLRANPEAYGYKGDLSDKAALDKWVGREAYRTTLREANGLGLYAKGADKLSVGVENDGGVLKYKLYDAKTGEEMSLEEARKLGYVRNYEPKPSIEPSVMEDTSPEPEVKAPEIGIETTGEVAEEVQEAEESDQWEKAWPDAPEAPVEAEAEVVDESKAPTPEAPDAPLAPEPGPETAEAKPMDEFTSTHGKAHFVRENGKIRVELKYARTDEDVERAAEQFGTSRDDVYKAFMRQTADKLPTYKINGKSELLLGKMEELVRAKAMLKEMAERGLDKSEEYRALSKQSGVLKGVITRSFKQLGLEQKLDQLERSFSGVRATEVIPEATEQEVSTEPSIVKAPAETKPESTVTEPVVEKGSGGIEFTPDYTPEEREKIAEYISRARLEKQAIQDLLAEYQQKYGERGQFSAFKDVVEKTLRGHEAHTNQILQQAAGKIPGHPEINMSGNMSPEQAARAFANAKISIADRTTNLRTMTERADDAFKDLK